MLTHASFTYRQDTEDANLKRSDTWRAPLCNTDERMVS